MNNLVEFILEKQLVAPNVLLDSIIEQAAQAPSSAQIIRSNHLLDDQKIIQVLLHQLQNQSTFQNACKTLGFWTSDIENSLKQEKQKQTPRLIQILTQKGLNYTDLINAVDNYQNANPPKATSLASPATPHTPAPPVGSSTAPPTGSQNPEVKNPELLMELLTEDQLSGIRAQVKKLPTVRDIAECTTLLELIFNSFHNIRGVGRYTHLTHIESLCEGIEGLITAAQTPSRFLEPTLRNSMTELLEHALQLLKKAKTDPKNPTSPELQNEFMGLSGQIALLTQLLKEVTKSVQ